LEVAFPVAETATTVESVVLFFSLSQTPSLSCNQIELISPSGTRSIILHAFKGFTNRSVDNSRMVTHAFYGEPLNGRWLLRYLDVCSGGVPTVLDAGIDQSLLFVAR
jgi:subtilisin-like proprotein convertase family protein